MIYIIDHKDSFTHNVVHQFENFDDVYCDNFNDIKQSKLNKAKVVVFSPGPGSPKDYPNSSRIYKELKGKKRLLVFVLVSNKFYIVKEVRLYSKIRFIMDINQK